MVGKLSDKLIRGFVVLVLSGLLFINTSYAQVVTDTLQEPPHGFIDSLEIRRQFIADSLLVREQFVRDSIIRKQRMFDSVSFLRTNLEVLLDAYNKTVKEDIIIRNSGIAIPGDSALGDYTYYVLPFGLGQPYTPWKVRIKLNDNSIKYKIDNETHRITSVQSRFMNASFGYNPRQDILVINETGRVESNSTGRFYLSPVDSVFFDQHKRIAKIKKYVQVFAWTQNNQRGAPLFLNLSQVREYKYSEDGEIVQYVITSYCERWKAYEAVKVCNGITYSLSFSGGSYLLTRRNNPSNNYSDGSYMYTFDNNNNLQRVSFQNLSKTENWEREIELNKEGNVNCYYYKKDDLIIQSLCMIYNLNGTNAKHPVEVITTTFEKDGISYFQENNTTNQSRSRDRLTLEWTPWK